MTCHPRRDLTLRYAEGSKAPRQFPSLPPPNRANPTARANSELDKTWGRSITEKLRQPITNCRIAPRYVQRKLLFEVAAGASPWHLAIYRNFYFQCRFTGNGNALSSLLIVGQFDINPTFVQHPPIFTVLAGYMPAGPSARGGFGGGFHDGGFGAGGRRCAGWRGGGGWRGAGWRGPAFIGAGVVVGLGLGRSLCAFQTGRIPLGLARRACEPLLEGGEPAFLAASHHLPERNGPSLVGVIPSSFVQDRIFTLNPVTAVHWRGRRPEATSCARLPVIASPVVAEFA
jgi:hypothetical protein